MDKVVLAAMVYMVVNMLIIKEIINNSKVFCQPKKISRMHSINKCNKLQNKISRRKRKMSISFLRMLNLEGFTKVLETIFLINKKRNGT